MDERNPRTETTRELTSEPSGRISRAWTRYALALATLTSCQSYTPRPLDAAAHRDAWHARTLADSSLRSFVDRLDTDLGGEVTEFDPSDGLTLREGRLVALVFHPDLRLARLAVARSRAGAEHAALWADPALSVSVLRITESVADRWVITPGLTFSIPLSGRLSAQEERADAGQRAAVHRAREAEWEAWHAVERQWFQWSAARLRVEETERLVDALDTLVETTSRLADRGELRRTEASLFSVEQAQRKSRLRRLRGDAAAAEQRLRAQLGLSPEAPVTFLPSLELPARSSVPTRMEIAERNPTLARLREEYDVAEAQLRLEIAKQIPDLTLGPLFESDQGQSRVGFAGGIPIPILNANTRAIAEARVEREIARAAFETEYERLVGRWAATNALIDALAEQRADIETVLAPLVDRQVEDALQLTSLGEGTSLVLLESFKRAHETKLELIETRASEALARAELVHLTGPHMPTHVAAEDTKPSEKPTESNEQNR